MLTLVPPYAATKYRIVIESLDVDSQIAQAHVTILPTNSLVLMLHEDDLRRRLPDLPQHDDLLHKSEAIRLVRGPLFFDDLGEEFSMIGLLSAQVPVRHYFKQEPGVEYREDLPGATHAELTAVGDPSKYAFDSYLLLGEVSCDTFATATGKTFARITDEGYSIDFRASGFVVRDALSSDLEKWTAAVQESLSLKNMPKVEYNRELWHTNHFAMLVKRPLFLRALTLVLGLVGLCSVALIGITADPKQFALNAAGYFLALWAIKSALSVGAPKGPTFLDYGILILYFLLVGIVIAKILWGFAPRLDTQYSNKA